MLARKNLHKPRFRLHVTTGVTVDLAKAKKTVKKFGAEDVTTVQAGGGGTLVLYARPGNFSRLWNYLVKKPGVTAIRIGN